MNTNSNAVTALVCGILSLICCGPILGPIALIKGAEARREIAATDNEGGDIMALIGMVLGGLGLGLWLLGLVLRFTVMSTNGEF